MISNITENILACRNVRDLMSSLHAFASLCEGHCSLAGLPVPIHADADGWHASLDSGVLPLLPVKNETTTATTTTTRCWSMMAPLAMAPPASRRISAGTKGKGSLATNHFLGQVLGNTILVKCMSAYGRPNDDLALLVRFQTNCA
jgi:hypothetical protein